MVRDEHIIEAAGKTMVVISEGKVISVGEPLISDCPLAKRFAIPVIEFTTDEIRSNIEARIRTFGMCTKDRDVLCEDDYVLFGASELLAYGLRNGIFDCAVIACDGAGTVIVTEPAMVQGIGGRMSGLVKTTPYTEVIKRIEENGGHVVDHAGAVIDQVKGTEAAFGLGYSRPAVTVASASEAEILRRRFKDLFIVVVHTTGLSFSEGEIIATNADLITACASSAVWDVAGKKALLQAGKSIPVFAMTKPGKELILNRIAGADTPLFVAGQELPVRGGSCPSPLI